MPISTYFLVDNFDPYGRSEWPGLCRAIRVHQQVHVCKIASLCVQQLWFVPPWLTSGPTHTQQLISLFDKLRQLG